MKGLKPGAAIMAVRINRSEEQWKVISEQRRILEDTRDRIQAVMRNNFFC